MTYRLAFNRSATRQRAFTLIELLMVIAIIAIVAGMLIVGLPGAMNRAREHKVRSELTELVLAIENYKTKVGYYPPDNRTNAAQSPLFYELMGTVTTDDGATYVTKDGESITQVQLNMIFNVGGLQNSASSTNRIRNFLPGLKASKYAQVGGANVLVCSVRSPNSALNHWRYVSSNPTNNPKRFDLWAEPEIGGTTMIIGNWK